MPKKRSKTKTTAAATLLPAWLKPLAAPLVISAGIHVAVVVTFVAMDLRPGWTDPMSAHVADEVTTSIQLAPQPSPPAPEPEPETPPVAQASEPAPEPAPLPEPAPAVTLREQIETPFETKVAPPAPAEPVITRPEPVVQAPPPPKPAPLLKTKADLPPAGFAGVKVKQAKRVVYAVDVSGAMAACLDTVLLELRRSIGRLDPEQQFQIVFFRQELNGEQRAVAIDDRSGQATLLSATPEVKHRVDQLLRSARPLGRSAPLAGLKRSLDFAPDVVFLLTSNMRRSDQGAANDAAVMRALDDLNPVSRVNGRRPVIIKTLQFVEDDPTGLMQAIAQAHGDGPGSYVQLKVADIERPDR